MSFPGRSGSGCANSYEKNACGKSGGSSSRQDSVDLMTHKLVLIGDSGVGKSCLLEKLVDDASTNTFISTIGVDIKNHIVKTYDGKSVKLQVWDTGGQQRYRPVLSTCYRNAVGIILVFDVTNRKSFANLTQWMEEVAEFTSTLNKKELTPKLLIGNKCDLVERREVDPEMARKFADEKNMLYVELSAITNTSSITEAFLSVVRARRLSNSSSVSSQS